MRNVLSAHRFKGQLSMSVLTPMCVSVCGVLLPEWGGVFACRVAKWASKAMSECTRSGHDSAFRGDKTSLSVSGPC